MEVYLDHAATTPVAKTVIEEMSPYFSEKFGNASSIHKKGIEAADKLEECRARIAKLIGAQSNEIIVTSGGSESDNLAIKGAVEKNQIKHIITSSIEHPAVLKTCKYLEKKGVEVTYLPVNKEGIVNTEKLIGSLTDKTGLVSIMHANNEIGTIQPIEEIGKICREKEILFHTDAVQTFGKVKFDIENIDMFSVSAHKIYGPKGVGFLYVKQGVNLSPQIHGGHQEYGKRAGTYNIPDIVGMTTAVEISFKDMRNNFEHDKELGEMIIEGVLQINGSKLNGSKEKRLPGNVNFSFDFIEGESLVLRLSERGVYCSTGSACSSSNLQPSYVLLALGLKHGEAHSSLRISIGRDNTKEEIEYAIKCIKEIVGELRNISPIKGRKDLENFS